MAAIHGMRMVVEHGGNLTVYFENVIGDIIAMTGHGLNCIGIRDGGHIAAGRAPAPDQVSKATHGVGVVHGEVVRFDPIGNVDRYGFGLESVAVLDIALPGDLGFRIHMIDFGHSVGVDSLKGGFGKHGFLSFQDKSLLCVAPIVARFVPVSMGID